MLVGRKTKIVATMGPSTASEESLVSCLKAGMNVARLNFSHGDHADKADLISKIHKISKEIQAPVSILQDLQGPKIRLGQISEMNVQAGDRVHVYSGQEADKAGDLPVDLPQVHTLVKSGDRLLIDDGLVELRVVKVKGSRVECEILNDGLLLPRKGVNLPNIPLGISSLTDKDLKDLKFGLQQNVDHIALSFVRTPQDILDIRKLIGPDARQRVVAKIEMAEAIENLKEIVELSDAVMVARGDLAVEVGQARLASLQKQIIRECNRQGKVVITATQMMESMRQNVRPTRAEITDVVNAVLDGSDALMLSAETATGKHPALTLSTMHDLIIEAEKNTEVYHKMDPADAIHTVPEGISASAALCAKNLNAKAIVCLSTTGKTARRISKHRPECHLVAVTDKDETLSSLELCWGVQTLPIPTYNDWDELFSHLEPQLLLNGIVQPGDTVVLTMGLPIKQGVKTNSLRVFTVGDNEGSGKAGFRFKN